MSSILLITDEQVRDICELLLWQYDVYDPDNPYWRIAERRGYTFETFFW